jgi:hypothetical protein
MSLLVLSAALALAGCGDVMRAVLEDDSQPPVKNEAGLKKLGQALGDALQKGDHAAAYALGAAQLKSRQTEEQFTAEVKNQWQLQTEGARPVKFEFEPWMPAEDEFDEWEGMPKNIKYKELLGIVALTFGLEVENDEILSGFGVDAVVVDEGGQPKIAYIEIHEAF